MNNYFKERMDEIQLRSEQMAEKKTHESEIRSLEEKLRGLENDFDRLETTWKSKFEQSALKKVNLLVAKEAHEFSDTMLDKNRALFVEEKRKLDELHWQVFEEQKNICDQIGKCVADNDTVSFLNEYPLVLKTHKYTSTFAIHVSDDEIKEAVAEHPEIKRVIAEIVVLETEIKKAEGDCVSRKLEEVLTEIEKLKSDNTDETQRLIDALECSHRERMTFEAEITEIENRKIDAAFVQESRLKRTDKDSKDIPLIKNEPQYTSVVTQIYEENSFKNNVETYHDDEFQISNKQNKKMKAKKWYEEYTRQLAITDAEKNVEKYYLIASHCGIASFLEDEAVQNTSEKSYSFLSEREQLMPKKKLRLQQKDEADGDEDVDGGQFGISRNKFSSNNVKNSGKFLISDPSSESVIKSCFYDGTNTKSIHESGSLFGLKQKSNFEPKNNDAEVQAGALATRMPDRKLEPLMATPSTFLNSAVKAKINNYSIQSGLGKTSSTATNHGIRKIEKTVKFTPKRPSNIGMKSVYRQTKLDDFHKFMLPNNYTQCKGSKTQ